MNMTLNDIMEFDHVIEIKEHKTVIDRNDLYAPNLYEEYLDDDKWELLNGFSGQYNYSGPIMHNSEFIGGGLEKYILDNPGVYVALVAYWEPSDDDKLNGILDNNSEGWSIARMK